MRRPAAITRCIALFTLLAANLLASTAPAVPASASGDGYRIAGKVVNADSGAPLANAAVAIVPVVDGLRPPPQDDEGPRRGRRGGGGGRRGPTGTALQSATTADDGSFTFDHVPAGKYSLEGSHRGFTTASYQEHGYYSTAIVTGPGVASEGLILELSSGAVINGSVLDAAGDPLEQATVSLYRLSDDGLGSIRQYRGGIADDQGAYEFARLPAGTYFVSAAARVWYAQTARPQAAGSGVSSPAANLDVVYPRTYYADAADSASATPIPVRGGDHLRVDLHLQAVPAVHLSYALPPSGPEGFHTYASPPMLFQPVFGGREAANTSVTSTAVGDRGSQTMQISVAPGEYEAEVAGHTIAINAGGDTRLDPTAGTASVEISGKIAAAPGTSLPDDDITLQLIDARTTAAATAVAHDGVFKFEGVRPGAYEVSAQAEGRPMAVVELAASGAPLSGHVLQVGTQPVTFAAIVAPASALIAGFARSASATSADPTEIDQQASGAMIVLVPEHLGDWGLYRRDQADSDGSFTLRQVAVGKYTLVAIKDGWDLEWAKPEVIAHYLEGGQSVTVTSTGGIAMHLEKPVPVQPR